MSTQREHTQKAHTYTLSKSTFEEVSELVEKYGYTSCAEEMMVDESYLDGVRCGKTEDGEPCMLRPSLARRTYQAKRLYSFANLCEIPIEENKNMPLTVGAARSLVRELFAGGDYVERKSIVEDILQHHTAKGGKDTPREKVTLAVKQVLRKFKAEGFAERHPNSTGYWKIGKTQPLVSEESSEQTAPAPPFIQDESGRLEADLTDLAFEAKSLAACATALESKAEELAARIGKP